MKAHATTKPDTESRILKFTPRTLATAPLQQMQPARRPGAASDPQRGRLPHPGESDDFRHRMLANTAGLVFAAILTAIGVWLACEIADLRQTQDCVLSGRNNCISVTAPHE